MDNGPYGLSRDDFNKRSADMRALKKAPFRRAVKTIFPPYFGNRVTDYLLDDCQLTPTVYLLDFLKLWAQHGITEAEMLGLAYKVDKRGLVDRFTTPGSVLDKYYHLSFVEYD